VLLMSSSPTAPAPYRLRPYCVGPHFFPNASALQPQCLPTRRMTAPSALTLLCPRGAEPLSSSVTSTRPRRHRASPAPDTPTLSSFAPLPTSIPPHAANDRLVRVDIDMPPGARTAVVPATSTCPRSCQASPPLTLPRHQDLPQLSGCTCFSTPRQSPQPTEGLIRDGRAGEMEPRGQLGRHRLEGGRGAQPGA
jgi:hypothetical protein